MDAIIINRVSDRRQKEGFSLEAQQRHGSEYAKSKGFNVIKEYTFQETASKQSQRKRFNEILIFIDAYPGEKTLVVIVEKSDRLGRNHRDKEIIQELYQEGKIEVHFYKENRIFNRNSNATDIFIDDIMTSVGKYASMNIAREAIKGMREKAEQGWFPMKAPFGYMNHKPPGEKHSIIVPDPQTKHIVQKIYELRDQGWSYEAIRLQIIHSFPPQGRHKNRFNQKSSIEQVLKLPFYGGRFFWKNEWYEGQHERILPEALFHRVRKSLKQRGVRKDQKLGLFTSWLKCACGCAMTYDPKTKHIKASNEVRRYDYYRCSNAKQSHLKLVYIAEDKIMNDLEDAVSKITITDCMATDISNALDELQRRASIARNRDIESYKEALASLEKLEDKIYDDHRAGLLDADGYKRQIERVREERRHFTNLMAKAQNEIGDATITTAKRVLELATDAKTLWLSRSKEERRDFLEKILSNRVFDAPSVRYEMKKPFQILSEMASSSNWCARQDSNL